MTADPLATTLDDLQALLRAARAMPMSTSCLVDRRHALELLAQAQELVPRPADAHVRRGAESAGVDPPPPVADLALDLTDRAQASRSAAHDADRMLAAARVDSDRMRQQADDYVDGQLANFEVVLGKTQAAVERGRQQLAGRNGAPLPAWDAPTGPGEPAWRDDQPLPQ